MATKKQLDPAPEIYAPPAGAAAHERRHWLAPIDGLAWYTALRDRHVELANEWAARVDAIAEARDQAAEAEAEYRKVVRDAVAASALVPPRPPELDPAITAAKVSVALEDSNAARDDLAECVLEVLAALRERRAELEPHLATFSAPLLGALSQGSANQRSIIAERLRRELAALESDGPNIEVFDDSSNAPTPELSHAA